MMQMDYIAIGIQVFVIIVIGICMYVAIRKWKRRR